MGYKYRQVMCYKCKHRFMWLNDPQEGTSYHTYLDKNTGKEYISATCPKCGVRMVVKEDEMVGYEINDTVYTISICRGI